MKNWTTLKRHLKILAQVPVKKKKLRCSTNGYGHPSGAWEWLLMCFSLESNYIWIKTHLQVFSHLAPLLYSSVVSQQSEGSKNFKCNTIQRTLLRRNIEMHSHLTTDAIINTGGWDKGGPVTSIGAMETAIRTSSSAWWQTWTTVMHNIKLYIITTFYPSWT